MGNDTRIEWTNSTWNPVTGCTKVSEGCRNCYAERLAFRLREMGVKNYQNGFKVTLHPDALEKPLHWKKSQMVFVNSMSDLFHEQVPSDYIQKVFDIMRRAPQHIFQILTKRSERLLRMDSEIDWPENVWMGVTVENEKVLSRIDDLRKIHSSVRFLSMEPLIGPVHEPDLTNIDWIIVGGESGPHARVMRREWVIDIRDHCLENNVPFFFKQWGGTNKKKTGRLLEEKTWDQMPRTA